MAVLRESVGVVAVDAGPESRNIIGDVVLDGVDGGSREAHLEGRLDGAVGETAKVVAICHGGSAIRLVGWKKEKFEPRTT